MPTIDLVELAGRAASRSAGRSEADVAADIRTLILYGGLNLEEKQVVAMEVPTADGTLRRIDIEAGLTVIEVKNDLRVGNVRKEAEKQLRGYVESRTKTLSQRYVGVLSDGAEWHLYYLRPDGAFEEVSSFQLSATEPDVEGLVVWLDGALATQWDVAPTAEAVERRLGSGSPGYQLDYANLVALYAECAEQPEIAVKRDLWAKLLTTASGTNFVNSDELFVNHTYLVLVASLIAHAVVGLPITTSSAAVLVRGLNFAESGLHNVVEADFFDWLLDVDGGSEFVVNLARRVARFRWSDVPHDVLKVLYESVISPEERHRLGEYYTPDWLASAMVNEVISDPLATPVLDPGCGSGTFLFWCVRRYLDAADAEGISNTDALQSVVATVFGADVHPVAVALARVTYLLAIGSERLTQDRSAISIPVYLGDSLQWGQRHGELSNGYLRVPVSESGTLWSNELVFPESVVQDASRFDRLVAAMADRAATPDAARAKAITAILSAHGVSGSDGDVLRKTFTTMCELHDSGRDHIWGYYVRNLVRPVWLSLAINRVKVLIGNPPWLAYRYMTEDMQVEFREQSLARNLWAGGRYATHQELAAYFVVRCAELYLREDGQFGFVMPNAALSRKQYEGFRSGKCSSPSAPTLTIRFERGWDLDKVRPHIFRVPAAVVFGTTTKDDPHPLHTKIIEAWSGKLLDPGALWEDVAALIVKTPADPVTASTGLSPYASRFAQGASFVPRSLTCVELLPPPALGLPKGFVRVRSLRTPQEKMPWKALPTMEGTIEAGFVRKMATGATTAPFRSLEPWRAVVPYDGANLLDADDSGLEKYPGLAEWWRGASARWEENRQAKSPKTLTARLNYQRGLMKQFEAAGLRVVYTTSGSILAAVIIEDQTVLVDDRLYWGVAASIGEAHYLCAILNSDAMRKSVGPLQSKGQFGNRHFHKLPFDIFFPLFDSSVELHRRIRDLGEAAADAASKVSLPEGCDVAKATKLIQKELDTSGISEKIEKAVNELLTTAKAAFSSDSG